MTVPEHLESSPLIEPQNLNSFYQPVQQNQSTRSLQELKNIRFAIIDELSDVSSEISDASESSLSSLFYVPSSPDAYNCTSQNSDYLENIDMVEEDKLLTKRYTRLKEDVWYPRLNSVRATVSAVLKKNSFTHDEAVSYTLRTLFNPSKPPKTPLNEDEMRIVKRRLLRWIDRKYGLIDGNEED